MTKEELRKEATFTIEWESTPMIDRPLFVHAYITGALPREKRIAELKAQIEKMKCCGNCIHCKYDENEESYEFCEKHQQVVNVAIVPCSEWKGR